MKLEITWRIAVETLRLGILREKLRYTYRHNRLQYAQQVIFLTVFSKHLFSINHSTPSIVQDSKFFKSIRQMTAR